MLDDTVLYCFSAGFLHLYFSTNIVVAAMFTLLCLLRRRWCGLPCLPVMLLVMSKYFLVCCLQSWALCAALCPAQHTAIVAAYLCIASYLVRMRCFLPHPCACMAAYSCIASYLVRMHCFLPHPCACMAAYLCVASYLICVRCFLPDPCACLAAYLCVVPT
jgi:hypothetical protein